MNNELSQETKDEILIALGNHQQKCDDMYFEMRNELARKYELSIDEIEKIWDES